MNPPRLILVIVSTVVCLTAATSAFAEPLEFSEVSLLIRARESQQTIVREVAQRKLVRTLTPQQEAILKTQGANDSLIQALRSPGNVLAPADATAYEARRTSRQQPLTGGARSAGASEAEEAADELHVFEVGVGHSVNLSRWGGPDYAVAFREPTRLDEGREDAVIIDNVRSFTHASTYLGGGRPDDSTTIFDRRNYLSIMDRSFTRGVRIDRKNPVFMRGVPYSLYPVYAAGGVSLYYIASNSDTVKLAVSTAPGY